MQAPSRVAAEVREIDVLFSPFPQQHQSLTTLGLLGKMATKPAIFEPFRNPATKEEIIDCLLKSLEVRSALKRETNRQKTSIQNLEFPQLWILTPTASTTILSGFGAVQKPDWVEGVHFLPEYLQSVIVALHQLPSNPETLWLRILGRGNVQKQAIDELAALPPDHPLRKVTLELLYNLQQNLNINQSIESDDRELVMRLAPLYQEDREQARQEGKREGRQEGRQEGKQEGRQEGETQIILRLLNRRFGNIEQSLIEKIQQLSTNDLESLTDALLDFSEVDDLATWLENK
ncbi:MAG: DUF4351 domain-containing protein [Nostocales cyanobacterium]|nr:MAG: DUF4351 domain-containing protein [Nostocales cyanobacterium]TAF13792.1 MAG: DUF4351 domain-containing protein [Nostocales cyanobacterium]